MDHETSRRRDPRHLVSVVGEYRTGNGVVNKVEICDLSASGCQIKERRNWLTVGKAITIKIGPLGPFNAWVCWIEGGSTGVQFAQPIYGPVFDHIRSSLDTRQHHGSAPHAADQWPLGNAQGRFPV